MSSPIAAGGVILDIAGALMLASSFMFKRPRSWSNESLTLPGGNYALMLSLAMQTADAQIGALLLVAGFGGQLVSSLGYHPDWACFALTLPLAFGIAVAAYLFLLACWRPRNARRAVADDLEVRKPDQLWRATLDDWGKYLDEQRPARMLVRSFSRRPGDDEDAHLQRLVGKRRARRLIHLRGSSWSKRPFTR